MKKILIILFIAIAVKYNAQVYSVGHMSVNYVDPTRAGGTSISYGINIPGNGRIIGTDIYYPAISTGNNSNVAAGKFPIVVLGHGFTMNYDDYNNIFYYLASKGYIVMLPRTESGVSPNQGYFARDLSFLAKAGINLNTISYPYSLSKFNGKVLTKAAIGGHSMGGGCSFLAAANNGTIACVFNFAAAETNPSSILAATSVTVPVLLFSGERDCVVDTTVQSNHYDSLASSNKFHIILKDLTHCDFSNGTSNNCNLGQSAVGCGNQISNTLALTSYMNYLEPFLNSQLKSNCNEGQRFMDSLNTYSSLRVGLKQTGDILCTAIGVNETELLNEFNVYPNPADNKLFISNNKSKQLITFQFFDITGKLLLEFNNNEIMNEIDVSKFEEGVYILTLTGDEGQQKNIKIIKQ